MQLVEVKGLRLQNLRESWGFFCRQVRGGACYQVLDGQVVMGYLLRTDEIESQIWQEFEQFGSSAMRDRLSQSCDELAGGSAQGYVILFHGKPKALFVSPELAKDQGILQGELNEAKN